MLESFRLKEGGPDVCWRDMRLCTSPCGFGECSLQEGWILFSHQISPGSTRDGSGVGPVEGQAHAHAKGSSATAPQLTDDFPCAQPTKKSSPTMRAAIEYRAEAICILCPSIRLAPVSLSENGEPEQ